MQHSTLLAMGKIRTQGSVLIALLTAVRKYLTKGNVRKISFGLQFNSAACMEVKYAGSGNRWSHCICKQVKGDRGCSAGFLLIQSITHHRLVPYTFMMGLSSLVKLFLENTLKGAPRGVSRIILNPVWLSIKINNHKLDLDPGYGFLFACLLCFVK